MDMLVKLQGDEIRIEDKNNPGQLLWSKKIEEYSLNENIPTEIPAEPEANCDILFWKEMGDNILLVYIRNKMVRTALATKESAYLRVLPRTCLVTQYRLDEKELFLEINLAVSNKKGLNLSNARLAVGERAEEPFELYAVTDPKERLRPKKKKYVREFLFPVERLTGDGQKNTSRIEVVLDINGIETRFPVKVEFPDDFDTKYIGVPLESAYYRNMAIQLKTTRKEVLNFVCRPKNPPEKTLAFRFWESDRVSERLYLEGKEAKEKSSLKVNLFYEKFCEKAEEGTFELFEMARKENPEGAYYILNKNSPDYKRLKKHPNVVKQFSSKYYKLLFRANGYISTETPIQANMIQANNKYFRRTIAENYFVFLQHGITYMKCQGKYSPFLVGREMEPDYMIVSSEKERRVVHEMLGIDEDRLLNTGMAIFSKLQYKHIQPESEDIVLLMLTWKQYEENIRDFSETSCYRYTIKIFEMLKKFVPSDKIRIVIHPKINALLTDTSLKENIWEGPIADILSRAKLLITDYSSVCYNSFYQGAGVVFYQEDLEFYEKEVGKLIPSDEEYIGRRAFSMEQLETMLEKGIHNQKIQLDYFRTKEFEDNYRTINEFSDGKNTERIFQELKRLGIL